MTSIQNIEKQDMDEIAQLFVDVFSEPPYKEKWSLNDAKKRLEKVHNECSLRIGKDAFIFCSVRDWDTGSYLVIEEIGVRESKRGRGIAKKLLDAVEKKAREQGIIGSELFCSKRLVPFWKKMGFEETQYVLMNKKL